MRAVRLTFFRVARGAPPAAPWLRPGVDEVSDFLVDHVADLRKRATEGTAANASFADPADLQLIEDIRTGDDAAFLAAARVLGVRLVEQMAPIGNAKPGLLLCATFHSDGTPPVASAAVLKLEVVSPHGAVLQMLDSGEETLAAVKDVLDKPGDLQKGLVFPDARPASQAVVGDKAAQHEARYFLRAMGATLEAHGSGSARDLVKAVAARAGHRVAQEVVQILPAMEPAPPTQILAALREAIPDLGEDTAAEVADALAAAERPVVRVDTTAPVKAVLRAGALTVSGPAAEVGRITWDADPEGGWVVRFNSYQEPKLTYP
jgi:hypothetical protein